MPTLNSVNKATLKEELEIFGHRLRLLWHLSNEEQTSTFNPFRRTSKFNPKGKDASIEMYLSQLEEEILAIDTGISYLNVTREEREALNTSISIKGADKGSAVIVWDREDYIKEAESQLSDKTVYEEVFGDRCY